MDFIYRYPTLIPGTLVKRYKRFLADVETGDGEVITAFCPNSGSMMGLAHPGTPAMLSESRNPARKTTHTLELLRPARHWVAVNTLLTNHLAETLVLSGRLKDILGPVTSLKREVTVGSSRLDFVLLNPQGIKTYMEVKSVTLRRGTEAQFPDAVTKRGTRHLRELIALRHAGTRALMLYLVQRGDCQCFCPAADIDPSYADTFREALTHGVAAYAVELGTNSRGIYFKRFMPHCG